MMDLKSPNWHYHLFKNNVLWIGLSFLILTAVILFQKYTFISSDVAWLLDAAQRFLAGGQYGTNFFEPNPPLIIYLYCLPVLIAKILNLSLILSTRCFTFLIIFISLILNYKLMSELLLAKDQFLKKPLTVFLLFIFTILPSADFAQREHLMLMLIMPYIFLISLSPLSRSGRGAGGEGPWLVITIGFLAAIGFSLKPYFLLTWVFLEIYLIFISKDIFSWLRVENLIIIGFTTIYFISIFIVTPTYISIILPFVNGFYLGFNTRPWAEILMNKFIITSYIAFIISIIFYQKIFYKNLIATLNIAMLGFMIVYIFPRQNWYYHMLPMFSLAVFSLFLQSLLNMAPHPNLPPHSQARGGKGFNLEAFLPLFFLITYVLPIFCTAILQEPLIVKNSSQSTENETIQTIATLVPTGTFYSISTLMKYSALAVTYTHAKSASRFPSLWMLPAMLKLSKEKNLSNEKKQILINGENFIRHAVVDDFQKNPPDLVIVDSDVLASYPMPLQLFDYLDFLSKNEKFKSIWKNYYYIKTINNPRERTKMDVYLRKKK